MGTHIPTYPRSRALQRFSAVLLALAVLAGLCAAFAINPARAYAAEAGDTSLAVVVEHGQDSSVQKVDGMSFDVYQVAGFGAGGGYEALPAYADSGVDFGALETADDNIEAAKKLAGLVANEKQVASVTTDKDGKASVGPVEDGIYLFVQTGAEGTAKKYNTLDPFLVAAPQFQAYGAITYDVVAKPKPELAPEPESSTSSSSSSSSTTKSSTSSSSPKTGDPITLGMMIACAAIGIAAMAAAIFASQRRKER